LVRSRIHFPVPYFMVDLIDHPLRRWLLQPPEQTPARHGIQEGMTVLEIGPGKGSYTFASASMVGEAGRIVAIDIEPRVVVKLHHRTIDRDFDNLDIVVADAACLPFKRDHFDLAYCIAVLGELPEPSLAIQEITGVIRPGGGLSVSEILPDPDYPTAETLLAWSAGADLEVEAKIGNLLYYTIRFRKN